jgi:hypothetical protein
LGVGRSKLKSSNSRFQSFWSLKVMVGFESEMGEDVLDLMERSWKWTFWWVEALGILKGVTSDLGWSSIDD